MKGGKFETFRVKGFQKVKRNDVIVFNYPYSDWNKLGFDLNVFYVKRCIAIPGDTLCIDSGFYKVKNCSDTLGNLHLRQNRILIPILPLHHGKVQRNSILHSPFAKE